MTQLQNLNYLLQNRDISYIIENNLTSEFFSDYKAEFDFIKTHYDEYGVIPDQLTFLAKFPTFDVVEVNETRAYLIDSLYEDLNKRKLAKIFNSIRKLLNEGKTDEALNLYISNSSEAIKSSKLESIDIFKDTTRYDEFVERGKDPTNFYVSTGFKELDELTGGWDRNEEIATIVARTGVGKTWCMLKTAIAAAESGLKVGIFSGEMSVSSVAYRVDTLISHISNGAIIHGNQVVKDEYAHYINNLSDRFMGTIRVMTPDMVNGKSGVTALRAFIEKEKLDMLCIDQHSLLEDDRNARNPVESASNISKDLKRLQVMKRIPIIAVSQQNRTQMGNGEVDSMQIAASDRIGQDSSTVVFITKTDDILTLNLVKARNSVSGKKISYSCDINRGIFQYIPEENNALDGAGSEELRQEYECNNEEREVF